MARFTSQSDSEPLMRLERPSTARSQTTAHVINACFNEILSHKPLDSKEINNLAVSKRENSESDYQEYYVDKLKKISDECRSRLEEISSVERHLMQARAKALAQDERNLALLVNSYPTYANIGLPQGPSQFRRYLDEELLAQHKLLIPSHYLSTEAPPSPPSKSDIPSFMLPTKSFSNHGLVSPIKKSKKSQVQRNKLWQDCLTASEREAEKDALIQLDKKTAYLKNPRWNNIFHKGEVNTASFGPLKVRKDLSQQNDFINCESFIIEPKEVLFSVYQPGGTYESMVQFKNISGVSRQLRLIPVSSPYFSVAPGQTPIDDDVIAPGMQRSYIITFTPDSLVNYRESMKVLTSNGDCLIVPLVGMRPPPELDLPATLDCGSSLVGDEKQCCVQCKNTGGEGKFRFLLNDGVDADDTIEESDSISIGPFLLSPREFSISAGGSVKLYMKFAPLVVGPISHDMFMACDNGQILRFMITGVAERICIGCTHIGDSSAEEKLLFSSTSENTEDVAEAIRASLSTDNDVQLSDIVCSPCVEFTKVNPNNTSFRTIKIHNFCFVDLPYVWRYYRPITKPLNTEEQEDDGYSTDALVPSDSSPFSILPSKGNLAAGKTSTFVVCFNPKMIGSYIDMGYFTFTGPISHDSLDSSSEGTKWIQLSDSSYALICLQMEGSCEPFVLEMYPPAIIVPGTIPISTKVRKRFKITNHSYSSVVNYQWNSYAGKNVKITVDPNYGRIVSGGSGYHEVVVSGHSEGSFSSLLHCSVDGDHEKNFSLHVQGTIQGPIVLLDCSNMNFGLILCGRSSSLQVCVSNKSSCLINFSLRQLVQCRNNNFIDHDCLTFLPKKGTLLPYHSTSINIECKPQYTGRLRSIVQLFVNGKLAECVSVEAEVQRPELCLDSCQLHMDNEYVGIPTIQNLLLRNNSLITAHFTWSAKVIGCNGSKCKINIQKMTGQVGPKEELTMPLEITWIAEGSFDSIFLRCDVLDMESPLFVSLSANVKGLSVVYQLLSEHHKSDDALDHFSDIPLTSNGKYFLDFGRYNVIGHPISLTLKAINTSAIPTSLDAHVSLFPAAMLPQPDKIDDSKYLLKKTATKSKSIKQEVEAYKSFLLRNKQGACFTVDPPCADIPAFGSVTLKITAYSDVWGEYNDQLICKIKGLENVVFLIAYGTVGTPIEFLSTATSDKTLVRFGAHPIDGKAIKRSVKMKNSGPVDLRVDWKVFNILRDDDKIIDLVTTFDDPFPVIGNILASKSYQEDTGARIASSKCENNVESEMKTKNEEEKGNKEETERDLFHVHLNIHEGVEANSPFTIHPKQTVIPAHSNTMVELTYKPTDDVLQKMGDSLCGYALGHLSIDEPSPYNTTRKTGYDKEPLRIDLMANIEELQLLLDSIDDGLNFECPASLLLNDTLEVRSEATQVHHFTLFNPTTSTVHFNFSTTSSYFYVSDAPATSGLNSPSLVTTLNPSSRAKFTVSFSFTQSDITEKKDEASSYDSEYTYEGKLLIKFSVRTTQEFPLLATVKLPMLKLSKKQCSMGVCYLEKTSASSFIITNISSVKIKWTACLSSGAGLGDVFTISPSSGILMPHLSEGKLSTQVIHVEFSPKCEVTYEGLIIITETITGRTWSVSISGSGSADEQHSAL